MAEAAAEVLKVIDISSTDQVYRTPLFHCTFSTTPQAPSGSPTATSRKELLPCIALPIPGDVSNPQSSPRRAWKKLQAEEDLPKTSL